VRFYYDKLTKILEERSMNLNDLRKGAKLDMKTVFDITNGYNIHNEFLVRIKTFLGLEYEDFFRWEKSEDELKPPEVKHFPTKIKVCQRDKKTLQIIRVFDSINEAARFLGKEKSAIVQCLKGTRKSAYGFKWTAA